MKSFIEKARKIHRNQKGFTLIELLVVMAILALLVGLVLPNFFGIYEDNAVLMIEQQHHSLRTAVFLYHQDTGEWPTEVSWDRPVDHDNRELWSRQGVTGWDGPYIERPILQYNRWGGGWGVLEGRSLNVTGVDDLYTVLVHTMVPNEVAEGVDTAMDDGVRTTGAVQFGTVAPWHDDFPGNIDDDVNNVNLVIVIARQE